MPDRPVYSINATQARPHLDGDWEGEVWKRAETARIDHFHPRSSDHRPDARARVLYSVEGLHLLFKVQDRYVRSIATEYQGRVWEDACVEFFVQPRPDKGYFNFEMNCGGTLLLGYAERERQSGDRKKKSVRVPWEMGSRIEIYHSMPKTIEPESPEPVEWFVEYFVPFTIFEHYVGALGPLAGQEWRGNFYKCAENNSHPHWAAWSPIGDELNFHQPDKFGDIVFAG